MMLAMPYLMVRTFLNFHDSETSLILTLVRQKNMDPELAQEVSQNHAKMAKVQSSLQSGNLMDR